LLSIIEALDKVNKANYFLSLDIVSDYHQIQVAEEDCIVKTFASPCGLYQCSPIPFGLNNLPGTFQCNVNDMI